MGAERTSDLLHYYLSLCSLLVDQHPLPDTKPSSANQVMPSLEITVTLPLFLNNKMK
jgi:hypothetical protein